MSEVETRARSEEQQVLIAKVKEMIEAKVGMPLVQMTNPFETDWVPHAILSPTGKIVFTVGIGINRYGNVDLYLCRQGQHVWGGCYDWLDDICHDIQKLNRDRIRRGVGPQPILEGVGTPEQS